MLQTFFFIDRPNCIHYNDISLKFIINILDSVAEPENKLTMVIPSRIILSINNHFRSGFSSLLFVDENFQSFFFGFAFRRFSPYLQIMDEKMIELIEAGFIQHWMEWKLRSGKTTAEEIGPQVLTMEHLKPSFVICLIPIIISGVAFLVEIGEGWVMKILIKRKPLK